MWFLGFNPGWILDELNINVSPIKLWNSISFGYTSYVGKKSSWDYPSEGWIKTIGIDGIQEFDGSFRGNIDYLSIDMGLAGTMYYFGVEGFIGTMVTDSNAEITRINGYARNFSIIEF